MTWSRIAAAAALAFALAACGGAPPAASVPRATLTPAEIAQRANPSVVRIDSVVDGGSRQGTGFVVARDGRVATNLHVVEGALEITVTFADKRKFTVREVSLASDSRDLAVLHIGAEDLVPLPLGDSGGVRAGDHVVAIGNPRGLERTVSDGLVSTTREVDKTPMLQISAPTSPGSSGGPLFNDRGEVVGITTAGRKDAQNVNFAIPSQQLDELLDARAVPLSVGELHAASVLAAPAAAPATCNAEAPHPDAGACEALCQHGDAGACSDLGLLYRRGRVVARDDSKAAELYKRACDAGFVRGCANLAVLYEIGEGVSRDYARSMSLSQSSCQHGDPIACHNQAILYLHGEGVAVNVARASQLFERSCDGGWAQSCLAAGEVLERAKKLDRAATFFQRACDHDSGKACGKLGTLMAEGKGVPRDADRAAALFARGCTQGKDVEACARWGKALVDGKGLAPDRTRGVAVLRSACHQGSGASCDKLRAMGEKT